MEAGVAQVSQCVDACDYSNLVDVCEKVELSIQTEPAPDAQNLELIGKLGYLYTVHLLAYILEGELNAARFLWKRIPSEVREHSQVVLAHNVLVAQWQRKVSDGGLDHWSAGPWDASVSSLVAQVAQRVRERILDDVGRAYKVITLNRLCALLSCDLHAARLACEHREWPANESGEVLPKPLPRNVDNMQMGEGQLAHLAEYVAYLERPPCNI